MEDKIIPAEDMANDPETQFDVKDSVPANLGESPYHKVEATVIAIDEDGVQSVEHGNIIGSALLTEERAAELNATAQRVPIGSKTTVYVKA